MSKAISLVCISPKWTVIPSKVAIDVFSSNFTIISLLAFYRIDN